MSQSLLDRRRKGNSFLQADTREMRRLPRNDGKTPTSRLGKNFKANSLVRQPSVTLIGNTRFTPILVPSVRRIHRSGRFGVPATRSAHARFLTLSTVVSGSPKV